MLWLALLVLGLILLFSLCSKPKGFPPGPAWFPVVGCFPQFWLLYSRFAFYHLVWDALARKYGPLVGLQLGKDRIVIVSGLKAIKEVVAKDECDGRPDGFFFRMRAFQQRLGVVFIDGKPWQEQRRFTTRHLRTLGLTHDAMEHIIAQETEDLVNTIHQKCNDSPTEGAELPLHNAYNVSVLNVLWAVVAGKRFELFDMRLLKIFEMQHEAFRQLDMSGGILNQMPFLRFVAPQRSGYNTLVQTIDANYTFLRESLAEHWKTRVSGKPRDLIDAYLEQVISKQKEQNSTFHELQLLTLCLDLFMAGSETTSLSLSFLLLLMLHHPHVQTRVQDELDHVVGTHRLPSLSDRPNLPYVEAVIMEMQRYINVAPVAVPHRAIEDCSIMEYRIPKDTILLMSVYSVHMDRDHWGDPEVFRPERFLDATGTNIIKDEWFIPFGIGKRRCLGEALARNSLFLFFTALMQNFQFSVIPGEDPPTLTPFDGVTLSPRPFRGVIKPRSPLQ